MNQMKKPTSKPLPKPSSTQSGKLKSKYGLNRSDVDKAFSTPSKKFKMPAAATAAIKKSGKK